MKFTTDGLIIKETNVGESDRAVIVLTRDSGVISAFASGARKPKSRNAAGTALLSYSSLTMTESRGTYRITESEVQRVFFDLRTDIERLSLAQYICELCRFLVPEELESEDVLRLALNALHFLSKKDADIYTVKAIAELRLMTVAGFMPDLVGCRVCGRDTASSLYLDLVGGDMLCEVCKSASGLNGSFVELDRTTFTAMRHIVYSDLNKLFSFSVPHDSAKYLSFVTERYLLAQTGHRFKTLEFFHGLETGLPS